MSSDHNKRLAAMFRKLNLDAERELAETGAMNSEDLNQLVDDIEKQLYGIQPDDKEAKKEQ